MDTHLTLHLIAPLIFSFLSWKNRWIDPPPHHTHTQTRTHTHAHAHTNKHTYTHTHTHAHTHAHAHAHTHTRTHNINPDIVSCSSSTPHLHLQFEFQQAFDMNGMLYHLATDGGKNTAPTPTPSVVLSHPSLPFPIKKKIAPRLGFCRVPVMTISTITPTTCQTRGRREISSSVSRYCLLSLREFLIFLGCHVPQKDGRKGRQEKQKVPTYPTRN